MGESGPDSLLNVGHRRRTDSNMERDERQVTAQTHLVV